MRKEKKMLNRTIAPTYQSIGSISIVQPTKISYPNGLECFVFESNELELLKFEFIFKNVYKNDRIPLINAALSAMLKEGTSTMTSAQIAEKVDFYGAYLMPEFSFDHTSLTLYTMRKYVGEVLPIVREVLMDSIIPQSELETYIRNSKQNLQISLEKNDVLARRLFYNNVFGQNRYGNLPTEEQYNSISREELLMLYKEQFQAINCTLMIAGKVDQTVLDSVESLFGQSWESNQIVYVDNDLEFPSNDSSLVLEKKEDALQSAIRLGGLSINRKHEDYPALQFVNTLFGGYFGSRLMKNIREEKGYTYSIGSALGNLKHTGFFTVVSEVGVDVTKDTLSEIQKEFEILRQDKTTDEEVDLVRNYMQGVLLGSLESIFSHMDKFKAVYFSGLDLSYYDYYTQVLQDMNSDKVQDLAIKYLNYDNLSKIVVGKID